MSHFVDYIKHRLSNNKNFLCVTTGPTGSGKTYAMIALGEAIDPSFNISRVAFTPLEFMEVINEGKLKRGSVVVFDEAGVGMSAQEWQSIQNKLINYVLQTFRHKNYVVLFTTPSLSFIAKSSRKLFHCHMETAGINTKRKVCKLKPFLIQYNQRTDKAYNKYLQVRHNGKTVKIERMAVGLPSDDLLTAYEKKKTAYTTALNKQILAELTAAQKKKEAPKNPLTERQEEVVGLIKEQLTVDTIATTLGVHKAAVYEHFNRIKKKGYVITPVREGTSIKYYEVSE